MSVSIVTFCLTVVFLDCLLIFVELVVFFISGSDSLWSWSGVISHKHILHFDLLFVVVTISDVLG